MKKKGRDELFERFMGEYMGFVYSIVYEKLHVSGTKEDIEECVSDVFVKLYPSFLEIDRKKGSIKTFVGVVARNTAIDQYRKLVKDKGLPLDTSLADESLTENDFVKKEENERVLKALLGLKEPDRTIVFRRFYLGESFGEIEKKTGYSQNALQKRLKRALERLKKILEEDGYGR